ncbi:MAG: aminoacyl-tRNA deacylase [Herpetosiphon sp.]
MPTKTNAMRVLEQRHIPYTVATYDPTIHSGQEAATAIGQPADHVFKTLVVLRDGGKPVLVVMPSDRELDLKRCAAAISEKRLRMATQKEAESLTGLLVGGISALALLAKGFPVYLDEHATSCDLIYVNAGQRGINLRLRPADFLVATRGTTISLL